MQHDAGVGWKTGCACGKASTNIIKTREDPAGRGAKPACMHLVTECTPGVAPPQKFCF